MFWTTRDDNLADVLPRPPRMLPPPVAAGWFGPFAAASIETSPSRSVLVVPRRFWMPPPRAVRAEDTCLARPAGGAMIESVLRMESVGVFREIYCLLPA